MDIRCPDRFRLFTRYGENLFLKLRNMCITFYMEYLGYSYLAKWKHCIRTFFLDRAVNKNNV